MSERLRDLINRLTDEGPEASHLSTSERNEIANAVMQMLDERRGAEAEDLRQGIAQILSDPPGADLETNHEWMAVLEQMLCDVDARDSLAYLTSVRDQTRTKASP